MSKPKKTIPEQNINEIQGNNNMFAQNQKKAPKFPFLFRRLIEILAVSTICSVPIALLYQFGFTRSDVWASRLTGVSLIAFVLINAYLLRAFFFSMGNKKIYFSVNALAYIIFAAINITILIIFGDKQFTSLHSYLFMPMKFANVVINMAIRNGNASIQVSCAIITHLFMLFVIIVSPFEMYSFDKKKK